MFKNFTLFFLFFALFVCSTKVYAQTQLKASANSQTLTDYSLSSLTAISPKSELAVIFFPNYLQTAFKQYQQNDLPKCRSSLDDIKINPYSIEPEKYYLLQAFCSQKPTAEEQLTDIESWLKKALAEKASNSDLLFAASLVFAEKLAFDRSLTFLKDAKWFNSFKKITQFQYFYTLCRVQFAHGMIGEAHSSVLEAMKFGEKNQKLNLILLELKIAIGDRKTSITLADNLKGVPNDVKQAYQIRSLMIAVDPLFHRNDIQKAAELTEQLDLKAAQNRDLAIAAIKSLLYVKNFTLAQKISEKALSLAPEDPLLIALKTQAFAEG